MKNYDKINGKSHIQFDRANKIFLYNSVSFTPVFVFIKIDSYVVMHIL